MPKHTVKERKKRRIKIGPKGRIRKKRGTSHRGGRKR